MPRPIGVQSKIRRAGEELAALGLAEVVRDAAGNQVGFKITGDGEAFAQAMVSPRATSCDRPLVRSGCD